MRRSTTARVGVRRWELLLVRNRKLKLMAVENGNVSVSQLKNTSEDSDEMSVGGESGDVHLHMIYVISLV